MGNGNRKHHMQWLYRVDGGQFRASNSDSSITLLAGPSIIETMFIAARVSARTLDAVEHSRTIMERWSFVIFHRGGSRISVIANKRPAAVTTSSTQLSANPFADDGPT